MEDFEKILTPGRNALVRQVVQKSDTAENYSSELNGLLATPSCVGLAIKASLEVIDPYLPQGLISVGCSMDFKHTAPTSLGMTINIQASILAVEGNEVVLKIKAWDEQGEVGHGIHRRIIVDQAELMEKARKRTQFLTNRRI
ncbi:MAG: thioesterase family protein [Selenomonadaceae bacterium]